MIDKQTDTLRDKTHRQTLQKTDIQTAKRQTHRIVDTQTDTQDNRHIDCKETNSQNDRPTDRHSRKQTYRLIKDKLIE